MSAPIENYQSGDLIVLRGLTYGSASVSGDVVTVWPGAPGVGSAIGSLTFLDNQGGGISSAATNEAKAAQAQINALACFAEGTRIATADGWRKVETLRVGDLVRTVPALEDGDAHDKPIVWQPIVWRGSRTRGLHAASAARNGLAGADRAVHSAGTFRRASFICCPIMRCS